MLRKILESRKWKIENRKRVESSKLKVRRRAVDGLATGGIAGLTGVGRDFIL
jgi:hypothetical protein